MKLLLLLGLGTMLVSYIWLLVLAFERGVLWGLVCLFFPVMFLVVIVLDFKRAYKPLALYAVGMALFVAVAVNSPQSFPRSRCPLKRTENWQKSSGEQEESDRSFSDLYEDVFSEKSQ